MGSSNNQIALGSSKLTTPFDELMSSDNLLSSGNQPLQAADKLPGKKSPAKKTGSTFSTVDNATTNPAVLPNAGKKKPAPPLQSGLLGAASNKAAAFGGGGSNM